ncbi:putative D-/L-hydantoinase subunit A [Acropora cervicornis]|uniref:D-/L-hydantoinase subunit A n=1 Tax=Acropora cervicornis TaxID=6130 RepID=A0AAD9PR28_ACRCE|nr:putative D-/L-hydantoinase subunit A [Acropora cervicornis]
MSTMQWLYIGVDVGGTNTDAVVLRKKEVLCSAKVPTTEDVTSGISEAIQSALSQLPEDYQPNPTQHRKFLTKVAVLRLCGPATRAIPPLCDFPPDLRNVVGGTHFFLNGGFQYDCSCITDVDEGEVKRDANEVHLAGIRNAVIVGVFSPASKEQEVKVAEIIRSAHPDMSLTLSHEVGLIGLLERENAAVLNESLKPLCKKTVAAFCEALRTLGLKCPFYLTQNDGTIISAEQALHLPVLTFASGPTNSMRGAAFLSGWLLNFELLLYISPIGIGGVNTNFQMPDVLSVGLGGGSVIEQTQEAIKVGPSSVAYKLMTEALVFGGKIITSTDIAVAFGLCEIGDKERTKDIPEVIKDGAMAEIKKKIEAAIDLVKFSSEDQPVILVGGGSVLLDLSQTLKGASRVFCPPNYQVANAVGAALSKVSGTFDHVVPLKNTTREKAWEVAERGAHKRAVEAGADEQTLEVIDKDEVPLAYLPGNVVRFYLKMVGDLAECKANSIEELAEMGLKISSILSSEKLSPFKEVSEEAQQSSAQDEDAIVFSDPYVDPATGDWILNKFDIECIAIGAGIMGCGGGGSPYLGRLRALELIKNKKEIRVVHPNRLGSTPELTGNVITPAFMGAPVILIEKLFSGRESISAAEAASAILRAGGAINEQDNGDGMEIREAKDVQDWMSSKSELESKSKVVAVVCAEIGGANSIEPLVAGAELGLPIVDADGMGRAFPELQMFLPFVYGSLPYPAAVGDEKGNVVALTFAETPKHLEGFLRIKTVEMGCMAGFAFVLDWKDVQEKCALHTLSRTWRLGNTVLRARHTRRPPLIIADVSRVIEGAFNKGKLNIEGSGKFIDQSLSIEFQNENYLAFVAKPDGTKSILATVPDLISLVDEDTGQPITTEEVRYGLRVAVVAMPCSSLWTTPQGLAAGGPMAFGYQDVVYSPVDSYEEHAPIPRA